MKTAIGGLVIVPLAGIVLQTSVIAQSPKIEEVQKVEYVHVTQLKSSPSQLLIIAAGQTRTAGWKNPVLQARIYASPPKDGIQDLDFVAEPPGGPAAQVLTPISAQLRIEHIPGWLKGVRVHSSTNSQEAMLAKRRL